ncbi:type II toxin-antitoxin system PemK/MazF family toxin [Bifidobacterium biavatii]|uniref:Transcriptional modulator of MazE/toxin, MazF n=1 Tax=Bifidobacterium biavatii DSM 23969 TaxID=1437608 RepID=A0A086ZSR6_9BIFI|nr:type II toxin-antitoxin system PemK/MazF family toxin [Bifidobacterium biavatii]KFI49566.1 transcriptional modulator of MazE/toxin, MazF [Bifidobacterium biavatii DSM 23969]
MNGYRRGDVIAADLDPSAGHEQRKRRYLLVISNENFNRLCNLTWVCPITSTDNRYPLHVAVHPVSTFDIEGFAEVEQLKSLDLTARNAELVGYLPQDETDAVVELAMACLI